MIIKRRSAINRWRGGCHLGWGWWMKEQLASEHCHATINVHFGDDNVSVYNSINISELVQ